MPEIHSTCAANLTRKENSDTTKVANINEIITPFGGNCHIADVFSCLTLHVSPNLYLADVVTVARRSNGSIISALLFAASSIHILMRARGKVYVKNLPLTCHQFATNTYDSTTMATPSPQYGVCEYVISESFPDSNTCRLALMKNRNQRLNDA